ncbi:Dihydroorotate dehydrogenase (quinone) [Methylobrevis pamukkalensis]|uniref:Dihydroorotate dehydrogenase (quinone) n=1 Tax=Methylobrevis pamukkalensis TaxID=1439726 RepID=A0A1E3GZW3_9HYPH|nr:Dihydroorotate dehydrogenase (quinone) [Methylobrevis pamukkalensis]
MTVRGYGLLQRALMPFIDGEQAHGLTLKALKAGMRPPVAPVTDPRLVVRLLGLEFPNPVGMAAGFDKNAEVPDALLRLGFGFTEVGTLTPRAQPGNPKPRIFRDPAARAVVNRLGFNNDGHGPALERLVRRRAKGGIVGVNVGANKDSGDRIADYETGIRAFAGIASYFTINVSSPNTPGLRDLQARGALGDLLARAIAARDEAISEAGRRVPMLLKIAPDVDDAGLADIAEVSLASGIDASSSPTPPCRGAACRRRSPPSRAACRERRCSSARPSCSPASARWWGQACRSSASAAFPPAPTPLPRSRRARIWCSSTPASSTRARGSRHRCAATSCG